MVRGRAPGAAVAGFSGRGSAVRPGDRESEPPGFHHDVSRFGYPIRWESQNFMASAELPCRVPIKGPTSTRSIPTSEKLIAFISRTAPRAPRAQPRSARLARRGSNREHMRKAISAGSRSRITHIQSVRAGLPGLQTEAGDAFDVNREPASVRGAYGSSVQATIASSRDGFSNAGCSLDATLARPGAAAWDSHDDVEKEHRRLAEVECDQWKPSRRFLRRT